jgi:hypothetical protein
MESVSKKSFGGLKSKAKLDAEQTQKLSASTLSAAGGNGSEGSVSILAGDDALVLASDITSQGNTNISAFDELVIAWGEELEQIDSMRKSGGLFSGGNLYSLKENLNSQTTISADASTVDAGGSINIQAGSALVLGSDLRAQQSIIARTDIGDIQIKAAKEGVVENSYDKEVAVGLGDMLSMSLSDIINTDDGQLKITLANASYDATDINTTSSTHRSSQLSANGNVVLDSVGDILIEGSQVIADAEINGEGGVSLLTGGNLIIKEATNTFAQSTEETHGSAELSVVVQHQAVEVAKAVVVSADVNPQLFAAV